MNKVSNPSAYWREKLAQYVIIWFITYALVLGAFVLVLHFTGIGMDDTDKPGERSGMSLLTDNLTGCQYLSRGSGLTPRLNAVGKQMGCR